MSICKKNAKSVEQIKQDYEQAADPGLLEFIQNVRPAKKVAPILIYVKKINGFYSVVEAINDGKRRRLDIITAYKSRKNPLK